MTALQLCSRHLSWLPGGRESTQSFRAIADTICRALVSTEVPNDSIQLVTTRDAIDPLLQLDGYVNLVIPRGSNSLVRYIKSNTAIPVLGHADGLCSMYLCCDSNAEQAMRVILDAKTGYPAACNSLETLLVDEDALQTLLRPISTALLLHGVSLRCDELSKTALSRVIDKHQANLLQDSIPEDYETEFLDLTLAIKTISRCSKPQESVELAIDHINTHGSHHTDAILTSSQELAEQFMDGVDSAGVFWNASTRFADGMRYGFGTEVGISTNKIHSRGPVGLEGLTIYKYKIRGAMQSADDYGEGGKKWKHQQLPLID